MDKPTSTTEGRQSNARVWFFLFFFFVYIGPSTLIAISMVTEGLEPDTLSSRMLSLVLGGQNTIFDIIQTSAFALLASISISTIWNQSYAPYIALVFCGIAIISCIVNSLFFQDPELLKNFSEQLPPDSTLPTDRERLLLLSQGYVTKIADTTLLYLGLLLGVEFVNSKNSEGTKEKND